MLLAVGLSSLPVSTHLSVAQAGLFERIKSGKGWRGDGIDFPVYACGVRGQRGLICDPMDDGLTAKGSLELGFGWFQTNSFYPQSIFTRLNHWWATHHFITNTFLYQLFSGPAARPGLASINQLLEGLVYALLLSTMQNIQPFVCER